MVEPVAYNLDASFLITGKYGHKIGSLDSAASGLDIPALKKSLIIRDFENCQTNGDIYYQASTHSNLVQVNMNMKFIGKTENLLHNFSKDK